MTASALLVVLGGVVAGALAALLPDLLEDWLAARRDRRARADEVSP